MLNFLHMKTEPIAVDDSRQANLATTQPEMPMRKCWGKMLYPWDLSNSCINPGKSLPQKFEKK